MIEISLVVHILMTIKSYYIISLST